MFGVRKVKNGCGQSSGETLKLTVSEEWTDGVNWFLTCWCRFAKIKSWSKNFLVGMVKNGSGQGTLNLTVSQKWTDKTNWFFACWYKFREGKSWFNDFWGVCQKWPWPISSWDPKICCVLRMNLWIELIFGMMMVMQ